MVVRRSPGQLRLEEVQSRRILRVRRGRACIRVGLRARVRVQSCLCCFAQHVFHEGQQPVDLPWAAESSTGRLRSVSGSAAADPTPQERGEDNGTNNHYTYGCEKGSVATPVGRVLCSSSSLTVTSVHVELTFFSESKFTDRTNGTRPPLRVAGSR